MSNDRPFSEREGFITTSGYQIDEIDTDTRKRIYNKLYNYFLRKPALGNTDPSNIYASISIHGEIRAWNTVHVHHLWGEFLSEPMDEYKEENCLSAIKDMLINPYRPWHRVFDFVEYLLIKCTYTYKEATIDKFYSNKNANGLTVAINKVMKERKVGYQIIDNKFVPIFQEQERQEVEKACSTFFDEANQHIKKAITLLADRENPDYENSIKESILSVEALAREVTGEHKKTLGALTDKLPLQHPAFREAIDKLYGFSSDAGGIRHSKTGKPLNIDQSTARFMLIICSAFVNYIISQNK